MEGYILTIIPERGNETPPTEELENTIKAAIRSDFGIYDSQIYLSKITN